MNNTPASCQYVADIVLHIRVVCFVLLVPGGFMFLAGVIEEDMKWILIPSVAIMMIIAVLLIFVPEPEVVIAWCSGG